MSRRGRSSTPISLFSFQDIITAVTGIMILVTLILALELIQRIKVSPPRKTAELSDELDAMSSQIAEIKEELAQSQAKTAELAGFDANRVHQQLQNLHELNLALNGELAKSERERQAARERRQEAEKEKQQRAGDPKTLRALVAEAQKKQEALQKLKRSNQVIFNAVPGESKSPWLAELSASQILAAPIGRRSRPERFGSPSEFIGWARQRQRDAEYFVLMIKPSGVRVFPEVLHSLQGLGFDIGFDLLDEDHTALNPDTGAVAE